MKVISILLILLGVALICVLGLMYLFGFVMSFDAPGSDKDLSAWGFRIFVLLPVIALIVALVLAVRAYVRGNYARSAGIASIIPIVVIGLAVIAFRTSHRSLKEYQDNMAQEAEEARLYPKQKFMRHVGEVTDTIIVFPNRIVAYRLNSAPNFPLSGPLGDLNASRDTLVYNRSPHTDIKIEELGQFQDEQGRKFMEVFAVK